MRRKTDEEFKQEVYDLVGDTYTVLDSYVNAHTKIRFRHNKCGNIYEVQPNNFIYGKRCPYCFGTPKKTDKQFKQEVYDLVGNEFVFMEHYRGKGSKIKVKHNKCGNTYEVTPHSFLQGNRCPYCAGLVKKTDKQFKQEVYDLVGNGYVFLDPYVNTMTKLRVKHNKCGNIYHVAPAKFLSGRRCPYCAGLIKKTDKQFKQEVYNLVGNEYVFLDSYVNAFTKIRVKHNKCSHIYSVIPTNFLGGSRCPYCDSPKVELIIGKILKSLGVNYEAQKTFDNLKDKSCLSYDFYLPNQNMLIEYQGIQHYQPVNHFGGIAKFRKQQKHDQMKSDYAENHGYNLIAVPYTEDTFSKIKRYLIKHGLK